MRGKKTVSLLLLLGLFCGVFSGCGVKQASVHPVGVGPEVHLQLREYDPEASIEEATRKLAETDEKCELISAPKVSQRKISLVFMGLAYDAEMEQLGKMLKERSIPAAFLVDGMAAAESSDAVEYLVREGFEVGNYTLKADKGMQDLPEEEIAASFAHAQTILKEITGKTPEYCSANATQFTDQVLHAAYCAGLKTAVEPSKYLAAVSLPSFIAAMGFVSGLNSGDVVAVKLNEGLDETEYEPAEVDERPAVDFDDALKEEPPQEEKEEPKTDILTTVRNLLDALETSEMAVVSLDRLSLDFDELVASMFTLDDIAWQDNTKEHAPVDPEWFDNALFIGDAQMAAFAEFVKDIPPSASFCAYSTLTPRQVVDNAPIPDGKGGEKGIFDEISSQNPSRIFVLMGLNDLSTSTNDELIDSYEAMVKLLREQFPDVQIILQGILPVTEAAEKERVIISGGRIKRINGRIAQLAEENGCLYIDASPMLTNRNGYMFSFLAHKNGVCPNKDGCKRWFEYLQSHVFLTPEEEKLLGEPPADEAEAANTPAAAATAAPTPTQTPAATPEPVERFVPLVQEQSVPASSDYFANAGFLGNSVLSGLWFYNNGLLPVDASHWFWQDGLTITAALSYVDRMTDQQFDKIYIGFGMNELNYDQDDVREAYDFVIGKLRDDHPGAVIYLMSATPVSRESDAEGEFTQAGVLAFNEMLQSIAAEQQVWYLDVCSVLCDAEGFLPSDVTTDGVHFTPAHYQYWFDYLATHYVPDED